jgi:hypothetical protein
MRRFDVRLRAATASGQEKRSRQPCRPNQDTTMNSNRQPELASHHVARVICALAAAIVTWAQFSGVVSIAEVPPMAMAGQRSNEVVAKQAAAAKVALAQVKQSAVAAR